MCFKYSTIYAEGAGQCCPVAHTKGRRKLFHEDIVIEGICCLLTVLLLSAILRFSFTQRWIYSSMMPYFSQGLLLSLMATSYAARAAPTGFPSSGNGLWYSAPATIWSRQYLPIGNGYLGAMTPGGIEQESTQLNIESLWSGGPFADAVSYT